MKLGAGILLGIILLLGLGQYILVHRESVRKGSIHSSQQPSSASNEEVLKSFDSLIYYFGESTLFCDEGNLSWTKRFHEKAFGKSGKIQFGMPGSRIRALNQRSVNLDSNYTKVKTVFAQIGMNELSWVLRNEALQAGRIQDKSHKTSGIKIFDWLLKNFRIWLNIIIPRENQNPDRLKIIVERVADAADSLAKPFRVKGIPIYWVATPSTFGNDKSSLERRLNSRIIFTYFPGTSMHDFLLSWDLLQKEFESRAQSRGEKYLRAPYLKPDRFKDGLHLTTHGCKEFSDSLLHINKSLGL